MAAKTDFVDGQVLTAEQLNALGTEINTNAAAVTAEETRATAAEALKANTADVGDKANLTTTEKGTLVGAINELNAKPSVSDAGDVTYDRDEQYDDGTVGAALETNGNDISTVSGKIGNLSDLTTTAQNNVVAAVNEVKASTTDLEQKISNISSEDTTSSDEEQIWSDNDETEEYAKIGSYGLKAKNYLNLDGTSAIPANTIRGKKVYSLCDSLGEGNSGVYWQKVIADRCGATFVYGNGRELIAGGTKTLNESGECGMDRARNLVANYSDVDVVLVQNINDITSITTGAITDTPFMLKNNVLWGTTYATSDLAKAALSDAIAGTTASVGTMIRIPYTKSGYKIVVSGSATASGNIVFTLSDGSSIGTPTINSGDSIATVLAQIKSAEWTQHGFSVTTGSNYVTIADTQDREDTPTITNINVGSIGITCADPIPADTTCYIGYCFTSYDVNGWSNTDNWKLWSEISLYSIYKGLFEYLMTNLPKAQIYFVIFPRLYHNGTSQTKRKDGSYDWDKFDYKGDALADIQEEVCKYMRVEYADLLHHCGVNMYNMLQYFAEQNVHPTAVGYQYFGEQIARLLF